MTPGQLSVVGVRKLTTASQRPKVVLATMFEEQVISGVSRSFTVIVKLQLFVFPAASVAVQFTVVIPFGKNEPETGLHTTVTPGQLSAVVTKKLTVAPHWPERLFVMMPEGQRMVGRSVSFMVTIKLQLVVRPALSVAVQFTVVDPFGKVEPDGGLQTTVALASVVAT